MQLREPKEKAIKAARLHVSFLSLALDPARGDKFLGIRKVPFVVHHCPIRNAYHCLPLEEPWTDVTPPGTKRPAIITPSGGVSRCKFVGTAGRTRSAVVSNLNIIEYTFTNSCLKERNRH
jgi:hypothetical protein